MATNNDDLCREWSRYQWASVHPILEEQDPPRWNAAQWVGDLGDGAARKPLAAPCPPETRAGFGGFGHASAANRWAQGYSH